VHRVLGPDLNLWVALAVSVLFFAVALKARLNYRAIPRIPAVSSGKTPPDCMVVIPARNEVYSIARAVCSFPHDTVIVVDDHSEDGTAEAARIAGAGVLPAPDLVRGAIGKSNACWAGARVLTSRWVLFADADTWYDPGFLDSAVAYAEALSLSFLSIYLQPECKTWAERMLVPVAVALYFCGMNPRADSIAAFNGQCVLVRREPYQFVGGHSAVLTQLIEDVKLAGLAQRHRMKFGLARAAHLGHVRMHAGLDGLRDGFTRNAFRFILVTPWIGARILLAALSMALWLPALVWLCLDKHWVVAAIFALAPSVLLRSWYQSSAGALLAPFGIYRMLPILGRGIVAVFTDSPVEWKGRTI
jgi:GT2 family glycosyltransferase